MKHGFFVLALLAAGCSPAPAANEPALPPVAGLAVPLNGKPCDPPLEIPASIIASVSAQFEEGRTTPPPPIPPEDSAAYQAMQEKQRATDWANLCRFHTANWDLVNGPPQPDRVVFMGDSITQLWMLAHPKFFGETIVNRGISGQTTPQMLLRFRNDVLNLKPAAVHILAGVNDIAGNTGPTTLDDVTNNIKSMVELAKASGVKVILATPLPAATFSWQPNYNPTEAVATYAKWIRRYAAEQKLTLAEYYTPLATPEGALKPEYTRDGVHPNAKGYDVMKPITQAAIKAALGR